MRKVLALIMLFAVFGTACTSVRTQPDNIALHYGGGWTEGNSFKECVDPGALDRNWFTGMGDDYYVFPVNQRSYDATGGEKSERGPLTVVSDDNAELHVPVSVTFTLNSDCATVRLFFEEVARKYGASLNKDGTPKEGWVNMLHFIIGKPLDVTLDTIARGYTWREIWNDEKVRQEFQNAINEKLPDMVAERTMVNGEPKQFFLEFNALVQKPDPVDDGLKAAIIAEQKAIAEARAQTTTAEAQKSVAEAEARTAVAKAQGEIAAARARAESLRASIAPFGSPDDFNKNVAVTNGINPWQPTIVYGVPPGVSRGPSPGEGATTNK